MGSIVAIVLFLLVASGASVFGIRQLQVKKQQSSSFIEVTPTTVLNDKPTCGPCPQYAPPPPDWCNDGTIVPGKKDDCGCLSPPTCDQTQPDWETYESEAFKFEFKYPKEIALEELAGLEKGYLQVNLLDKKGLATAIFSARTNYSPDEVTTFLGIAPNETKTINGNSWLVFKFPDGDSGSPPFFLYQAEKNKILYLLKFYTKDIEALHEQITTSFKFIE